MFAIFQSFLMWFFSQKTMTPPHEREGKIDEVVEPGKIWWVWHEATFWFARSHQPLDVHPGDRVKVVERQGLVLFIEPLESDES